jgi:hypothetical protein
MMVMIPRMSSHCLRRERDPDGFDRVRNRYQLKPLQFGPFRNMTMTAAANYTMSNKSHNT